MADPAATAAAQARAHDRSQAPDPGVEAWRHMDPDYDAESGPAYDDTLGGGFDFPAAIPSGVLPQLDPAAFLTMFRSAFPPADQWIRERAADRWAVQQYSW